MALDFDVTDLDPISTLVSRLDNIKDTLEGEKGAFVQALKDAVEAALVVIEEALSDAYREISTGDLAEAGVTSESIDAILDELVGQSQTSSTSSGSQSSTGESTGGT